MAWPFSNLIVDVKTRKVLAACTVVAVVVFILGIVIGYVSGSGQDNKKDQQIRKTVDIIAPACRKLLDFSNTTRLYMKRYKETNRGKFTCLKHETDCWDNGLPRHYIAYHLNNKMITMDGKLEEKAWTEVSM